MMCKGSGKGEHKYTKFDEVSVVCERCGERKVVAAAAQPWWGVLPPAPWYPTYVPWTWPQPWSPTYIWSDTGSSVTVTNDFFFGDTNKAYFPRLTDECSD